MLDNMKGVESFDQRRFFIRRRRRNPAVSGIGRGGEGSPIKAIQQDLARIGAGVRPTGRLDEATINAINGVFGGWDDAPKAMATGKLTAQQISRNAPVVARYLHKAVAQMTTFADVNE